MKQFALAAVLLTCIALPGDSRSQDAALRKAISEITGHDHTPAMLVADDQPGEPYAVDVDIVTIATIPAEAKATATTLEDGSLQIRALGELSIGASETAAEIRTSWPAESIEVYRKNATGGWNLPPEEPAPVEPMLWRITGEPGEVVVVRIPIEGSSRGKWEEIKFPGKPEPPPPPLPDERFKELEAFVLKAKALLDQPTAERLSTAWMAEVDRLQALCDAGNCPDLEVARLAMVQIRRATQKDPDQPWHSVFFDPIDDKLAALQIADTSSYLAAMRAIAGSLEP